MATPRILPELTPVNRPFWTGGAGGRLLIQRCAACDRWQHPPAERCGGCAGPVTAQPVGGEGTVFTFTVNEHRYHPEVPPPYVIAIVELAEQEDLRLPTNIVGCDPATVAIGMPVEVLFEQHGEHAVPLFAPAGAATRGSAP
jgi:uncharacterized OB-fold protein